MTSRLQFHCFVLIQEIWTDQQKWYNSMENLNCQNNQHGKPLYLIEYFRNRFLGQILCHCIWLGTTRKNRQGEIAIEKSPWNEQPLRKNSHGQTAKKEPPKKKLLGVFKIWKLISWKLATKLGPRVAWVN